MHKTSFILKLKIFIMTIHLLMISKGIGLKVFPEWRAKGYGFL